MHSQPIECDVPVHMQCKMSLHVISCHIHNERYMDNSTHAYHQCIMDYYIYMHIICIHYFTHVNISCKHILTFICNMSFYDQAMTLTQASHAMAIAHNNSSHIIMLEHTLTSKHVTLNQAMTHSNSHTMAPKASHNNHKTGHETDPRHATNIGLGPSQVRLGAHLGVLECLSSLSPGSPRQSCLRLVDPFA